MMYRKSQNITLVIAMVLLVQTMYVTTRKRRECRKREYSREVGLPGVYHPSCRKNITLHKCEGYCRSESGPVVDNIGTRWDFRCNCCQPARYKRRKVLFHGCGSIFIHDIKKCNCLPC